MTNETIKAVAVAPGYVESAVATASVPIPSGGGGGGGATLVFGYADFSSAPSAINLAGDCVFSGNVIRLINNAGHNAAAAWYKTQQPPSAFTTTFSFTPSGFSSGNHAGMVFGIQNTVAPPGQSGYVGDALCHDANMCGWGGAVTQYPPIDSVCIKFDAGSGSSDGQADYPSGGNPSSTGIYFNGGPGVESGKSLAMWPANDLNPYGINFYTYHTYDVTIVYDGSIIVMTILDTYSGAQARFEWPLNLANTTNSSGNYVGFTAGTNTAGLFQLLNWYFYSGYNTRVASPTFSPAAGQYSGSQTVTIVHPSGSTCYYTTNGLLPTTASTKYTGPITVSSNTVIKAIAVQSGYTDSLTAVAAYQIGTANVINFPSGFAAGNLIPCGISYLSGNAYRITDGTNNAVGAVWFPAQVNIQTFSTTFQLNFASSGQGMGFVIQNDPAPYNSSGYNAGSAANAAGQNGPYALNWGGGCTVLGTSNNAQGYGGLNYQGTAGGANSWGLLNSVGVIFSMYGLDGDPNNAVGMYTNGANPWGAQTATGFTFGGNTFNCTLTYDGTTLSLSMQNASGGSTFNHSWTVNIPATIGWDTAYVGFVGGTGGAASIVALESWEFTQG